jgi:hypothetical protein
MAGGVVFAGRSAAARVKVMERSLESRSIADVYETS